MQFSFFGALGSILASSGFASFAEDPRSLIMIIIACVLLYMGIGKKFEPHAAGQPAADRPAQRTG